MAAGCKRDSVWEYFNEVSLAVGKTGMHAKCKQHKKEMQGLVARMKQHNEKCFFSGGSCIEEDEMNMSEHAGESILKIQDSEDYPPSRSSSFSIVSELSANDSVSVTSCMSHSQSISPVAKRKKNLHHSETTIDTFMIRTSRLQKETLSSNLPVTSALLNGPYPGLNDRTMLMNCGFSIIRKGEFVA